MVRRLHRRRARRGSAFVLVIVLGALIAALALVTAGVAQGRRKTEGTSRQNMDVNYQAEAAIELLRLEITRDFEASNLTPFMWIDTRVRPTNGLAPGRAGYRTYPAFPNVRAWIESVAPTTGAGAGNWIEIVAASNPDVGTTSRDDRKPVSIRTRLVWGNNPIFDLAMLSVTTNCMWCHVHIKGDIGAINTFDPSHTSNMSSIDGNVYSSAATYATGDVDIGANINDSNRLEISGSIFTSYTGAKLPKDTIGGDGVPDFPAIDPTAAEAQAAGAGGGFNLAGLAGGTTGSPTTPGNAGAWRVPLNGSFASDLDPLSSAELGDGVTSVIDGNLILIGTDANPIQLNGDIYVKGDVMIRGPYTGKGAIYSGRNVYMIGDVYLAPSAKPAVWPPANDAGAQSTIANEPNAGELRLAARSNVIMGDWTYRDSTGTYDKVRNRQGQEFINSEFALHNQDRFFKAAHDGSIVPSEVKQVGSTYVDDQGATVDPQYVTRIRRGSDNNNDGDIADSGELGGAVSETNNPIKDTLFTSTYDSIVAPGRIVRANNGNALADGTFQPWMSQSEFRSVLGTETYENMVWRSEAMNDTQQAAQLGTYWDTNFPSSSGSRGRYLPAADANFAAATPGSTFPADAGRTGVFVRNRGWGVNVLEQGMSTFAREVRRVDAFVYANKRIAGRSTFGMTINGGLAATHVGFLAPGTLYPKNSWISNTNLDAGTLPASLLNWYTGSPVNSHGDSIKESKLSYDYRLRNGGYGFNLVEGAAGDAFFYVREGKRTTALPPS